MKNVFIGIRVFLFMSILTGVVYPLLVTSLGQGLFSKETKGSLIYKNERVVGSELLAQKFTSKRYFWPRPSAAEYNGMNSAASNYSLENEAQLKVVAERKSFGFTRDMLFASGSGLDPHISPEAAIDQLPRIERERGLTSQQQRIVMKLIQDLTQGRQWGFLGEPRVNVLSLNLAMDAAL